MPNAIIPRLLIADDDANVLSAYMLFFETYGYEIRTAGDGADALIQYCGWRPHAVVLDIEMPGMDGRAVAKEIRRLHPGLAILLVAVTSLSLPSERAASIPAGFNHHLVKPVKLPLLGARLSRHFQTGKAFRCAN